MAAPFVVDELPELAEPVELPDPFPELDPASEEELDPASEDALEDPESEEDDELFEPLRESLRLSVR